MGFPGHQGDLILEDLGRPAVHALRGLGSGRLGAHAVPPAPEQEVGLLLLLGDAELGENTHRHVRVFTTDDDDLIRFTDPAAQVSTGPGLPQWIWRSVRLSWRGPVEQTQPLRLVLTPPWVEFLLAWLRVGLLALLAVRLLDVGRDWLRGARVGALTLIGVALLGGSASRPAAAAEFPSPELLGELRTRLLEAPECFPKCATIPHLRLEVTPGRLRARVEIDVAWETAVPLPGGTGAWDPERVTVDGDAAGVLAHSPDGRLWIALSPGRHRVVMEGGLPERETLQLPLPLRPRRVEAQVEGWTLEGIREDGVPESSLQLTRTADRGDAARATLEPTELPPFVRVERRVQLGLTWQVATRVVRVSPPGQTVFLEIPLLAGESVTAEGIRVEDGHAQVSLAPHARETGWVSDLEPSDTLELRAPEGVPWVEVWPRASRSFTSRSHSRCASAGGSHGRARR